MIRIYKYGEIENSELFTREDTIADVAEPVRAIIADVVKRGDQALRDYTARFDGAEVDAIEVSREELDEALELVDPELLNIMKEAAANIRHFHEKQVRNGYMINDRPGIVMGQKIVPIDKAGIYVPGGTAAYPSTVLMDTIPAKIAGCGEIVITTPPGKNGKIAPAILAAAQLAGADRIFKVGGAQAIAALAYGTETVPKVDKIVGPGNVFVAEAKKQVFGRAAIDMIAGPSEILVIADAASDPAHVAADMLSQAEHDKNATAVLVTDSYELAEKVSAEIERQIVLLPRYKIARASIDKNGKIIVAEKNLDLAADISNEIAPEHLELCMDDPFDYLDKIRHAGSVFMGRNCPEALGDYFSGANHTLPTMGAARFSSPLGVEDFTKRMQYTYYTKDALGRSAEQIELFAAAEGLDGHARSVMSRFGEIK